MVDNPQIKKRELVFRALRPQDDLRLIVPLAVIDSVLSPSNPLNLTDEQREAWATTDDKRIHFWPSQVQKLYDLIAKEWSRGIDEPRNRVISAD